MTKVADYTKRAINKYNQKFDRVAVNLPKGSKKWISDNVGMSANAFFNQLFAEYQEQHETGQEKPLDARQNAPGTTENPHAIENPPTAGETHRNAHTQPETIKDSLRQPETAGEDPTEFEFLPFE